MVEQRKLGGGIGGLLHSMRREVRRVPPALPAKPATTTAHQSTGYTDQQSRIQVTVHNIDHSWDGIALITLRTHDGKPLAGYEPGCHSDIHIPTSSGQDLIRPYSLFPMSPTTGQDGADPAGEKPGVLYGIAVKLETDSRGGSAALHRLTPGDVLEIEPPRNNFALVAGAKRSILIGAGVGIAPVYSLARGLEMQSADYEVLYFASSVERAVLAHLFEDFCSGQTQSVFATGARNKQAHHITQALAGDDSTHASEPEATHVYVCGPQGFMETVIEIAAHTLPPENIHWETFRPSEQTLAGDGRADGAFHVLFRGETYEIPPGQSVCDIFEEEDVPIMSRCLEGTCGTCIMKVVDGTPDHRDSFFTEEQHKNGAFATCVSRSLSPTLTLERWKNPL